jgi:hypothetical protein
MVMAFTNNIAASAITAAPAIRIMVLDLDIFGIALFSEQDRKR